MESQTSIKGSSSHIVVKAAAAALAAAALLSPAIMPTEAMAADMTKVYTWQDGQSQPAIPQTITGANGQVMTIASQSAPIQASPNQTTTQFFQESYSGTCGADQLGNVLNIVPATFHVNSNGFVGDIPRVGNISYTPVNRPVTDRMEQTRTGTIIDPQMVPQSITHEGRVYSLSGNPTITPDRTDSTGTPITWKYSATYVYERNYEVLDHYDLSAQYAGNLTKTTRNAEWSIAVVYHSDDPVAAPVENTQPQPQPVIDNPAPAPAPAENPTPAPAPAEQPVAEAPIEGNPAPAPEEVPAAEEIPPEGEPNPDEATPNEGEENSEDTNRENPFESSGMNRISGHDNEDEDMNTLTSSDNENTSEDEGEDREEKTGSFPIPLIAAIGAGLLALLGLLAFLLGKKKKKKKDEKSAAGIDPTIAAMAAGAAGTGVAGAAVASDVADSGVVAAAAPVDDDPVCQLISVKHTDEGFEQNPMANLSLDVSGDESVPSVVRFPEMIDEDGDRIMFTPEDGADYWVAIEDSAVDAAVSDTVIVATDDGQEVYRGHLDTQFQLNTDTLVNSLNGTVDPDEVKDISEELTKYAEITDIAPIAATAAAGVGAATVASHFGDDGDEFDAEDLEDFSVDFEDESETVSASEETIDIDFEDDEDEDYFTDITVDVDDSVPDDDEEVGFDYDEINLTQDTDDIIEGMNETEELDFEDLEEDTSIKNDDIPDDDFGDVDDSFETADDFDFDSIEEEDNFDGDLDTSVAVDNTDIDSDFKEDFDFDDDLIDEDDDFTFDDDMAATPAFVSNENDFDDFDDFDVDDTSVNEDVDEDPYVVPISAAVPLSQVQDEVKDDTDDFEDDFDDFDDIDDFGDIETDESESDDVFADGKVKSFTDTFMAVSSSNDADVDAFDDFNDFDDFEDEPLTDLVAETVSDGFDDFDDFDSDDGFVDAAQGVSSNIMDTAVEGFSAVRDGIADTAENIKDEAASKISGIRSSFGGTMEDAAETAQDMKDAAADKASSIEDDFRNLLSNIK